MTSEKKRDLVVEGSRDELSESVGVGGEDAQVALFLAQPDVLLLHEEDHLDVFSWTVHRESN